jgi:hypothetical protein
MTDFLKNSSIPGLGWANRPVFQLGEKSLAIPMSVHRASREKLVSEMKARGISRGVALLRGGEEACYYDSDAEMVYFTTHS